MVMGCYGIGITRIVAAAIEQNHDDSGIIWPAAMAPFDLVSCRSDGASQRSSARLPNSSTAVGAAGLSVF